VQSTRARAHVHAWHMNTCAWLGRGFIRVRFGFVLVWYGFARCRHGFNLVWVRLRFRTEFGWDDVGSVGFCYAVASFSYGVAWLCYGLAWFCYVSFAFAMVAIGFAAASYGFAMVSLSVDLMWLGFAWFW
jgi:hypothetical protein